MMALRTLIVVVGMATTASAQVGTKKEVIRAAKKNEEPAYIKVLLEKMSRKIHQAAAKKNLQDPTEALAWLHTMAGILDAIHHAAVSSSSYTIKGVSISPYLESGLTVASRTASEAAAYCSGSRVWEEVTSIANDIVWFYAYLVATNEAKEVTASACRRVCEWAVLNWLYDNIGTVIEDTYWKILNTMRQNVPCTPFENGDLLFSFYNKFFASLNNGVMQFQTGWLIHVIPMESAIVHRTQFLHFWALDKYSDGELVFFWANRLRDNNALHAFPNEIVNFILSTTVQLDAPISRKRVTKCSRSCVLF